MILLMHKKEFSIDCLEILLHKATKFEWKGKGLSSYPYDRISRCKGNLNQSKAKMILIILLK